MYRRAGIAGIKERAQMQIRYEEKRKQMAEDAAANLHRQLETVKSSLEYFASKYQSRIRQDHAFRTEFQSMCANIGVDPLASSDGYWSKILGIGDFYYHLAVRIIEICMANQRKTAGLMPLEELILELNKTKSSHESDICQDDVIRAIKKLQCLGNGFKLIRISDSRQLVQSVPGELSMDQTEVLKLAESHAAHINVQQCVKKLGWTHERAHAALEYLMQEGMAWVDESDNTGRSYWFPSLLTTKAN
ncbi:Vacuolar-sorting protein SNF8 [Echinococcus granulosus]|uniref:Vacuolar-sorting protein SNF8 n=1 Tax=Echinococcus granulosus TaxID=6210 RepID=U6J9J8_ECHGR|nr:Vacuolar-sorting protein SNF8 [Echinococcus granulosus]EUB62600.1 Vacuolar-sorting protein SNF8 [Echinococcus granulosus]KAH9280870.1 Vacuolar-sorting protein SNF8 [Echinococcus granulosus]CDS19128.1 vacuolar sorting protein SNF8 [Echinococcus granulosus]